MTFQKGHDIDGNENGTQVTWETESGQEVATGSQRAQRRKGLAGGKDLALTTGPRSTPPLPTHAEKGVRNVKRKERPEVAKGTFHIALPGRWLPSPSLPGWASVSSSVRGFRLDCIQVLLSPDSISQPPGEGCTNAN